MRQLNRLLLARNPHQFRLLAFTMESIFDEKSIVKIRTGCVGFDRDLLWRRESPEQSSGSAVVIEHDGRRRLLTCAHCVAESTHLRLDSNAESLTIPLHVAAVCHDVDLALLDFSSEKLQGKRHRRHLSVIEGLKPLKLFNGLPKRAQPVQVVGFPGSGRSISATQGVVSRVDMASYVHSHRRHLVVQVDAAINGGNSGGALLCQESDEVRLLGIVHQGFDAKAYQGTGDAIPVPVLEWFLREASRNDQNRERGSYMDDNTKETRRLASLGLGLQLLRDDTLLQRRLSLPSEYAEEGIGVLVVGTSPWSSPNIEVGDVLLKVDGCDIRSDGRVRTPELETPVHFGYMVQRKHVGDTVTLRLWRSAVQEEREVNVTLCEPARNRPAYEYDHQSSYVVFGGIVLTRLSEPLMAPYHKSPSMFKYFTRHTGAFEHLRELTQRPTLPLGELDDRFNDMNFELVTVSRTLVIQANQHMSSIEEQRLVSINGTEVWNVWHTAMLLKQLQLQWDVTRDEHYADSDDDASLDDDRRYAELVFSNGFRAVFDLEQQVRNAS
ncbi:MAG: hypothetical protein MHM6MM_000993 [Cercozoa sp. M6MM]